MEISLTTPLLLALAIVSATTWYALDYFYVPKQLSNEPPLVGHHIPYIGHVIGLIRHGTRYYQIISSSCNLPIYTLKMLNIKIYVVTSPVLVNAVNRNSKKIAFNPFIAQLGKRMTGHDEATGQIVQHNLNGEDGPGYVIDVHDGTVASLAPGKDLEEMTRAFLKQVSPYLDALANDGEINLFEWTRDMVTMCSTRAVYGPENPFNHDKTLIRSFWQYDHDLNLLIADILPSILAPKGHHARTKLALAFQTYFENYNPCRTQSSAMIRARYTNATRHGITSVNQARLEVGTLIGILANTIPTIFYLLVHIYHDAALLSDIRSELATQDFLGTPEQLAENPKLLAMPELCPLLHSTFQELLRVHALGTSARYILDDVLLVDKYLLQKGMIVQMPMAVMHNDPSAWGDEVNSFQPRRFLKSKNASTSTSSSTSTYQIINRNKMTAYRPFGGGASLCPGRHFVTLETMALAACLVARWDMSPMHGQGERGWNVPVQRQESLATNVFPPAKDIRVKVTLRETC